jgi:hypothetical protein
MTHKVELIEVPKKVGKIVGVVVHKNKIFVACEKAIFTLDENVLTPIEVEYIEKEKVLTLVGLKHVEK